MKKPNAQGLLIASLCVSVLLASAGTSMANTALPFIARDLKSSFANARWIILSYLLASTVFSFFAGRLGDLTGHRKMLLAGTSLYTIGTFACGYAATFNALIFARIIQGLGTATLMTLPMALATVHGQIEKTAQTLGLLATMSAVGTTLGPSLGGFILSKHGWRATFFSMTALGAISFFLLLLFVPHTQRSTIVQKKSDSFFAALKFIYLNPFLKSQLLYNFIVSVVMMTTLITGPFYLIHGLQMKSDQMGLIMSTGPITSAIFGFFSGYMTDRHGSIVIIQIGLIQLLIGALSFVLIPSLAGAIGFSFCAFLLSVGYQLFLSANSSRLMTTFSADQRGSISGALSFTRNLGLMSGTFFMGGIFDLFGFQFTFLIAAALVALLLIDHSKNQKRRINETRSINKVY